MHSLPLALCIIVAWFALAFALAWIIGRAINLADTDDASVRWAAHTDHVSHDAPGEDADRDGLSTSHGDIL